MSGTLIELHGATRRYAVGEQEIVALRGVDLDIRAGEMIALMGASGSGKSTLMNILGCLDRLSEGSYRLAGKDIATLDRDALAAWRRAHFGFVFQRYNLLPQLSALSNVEMPAIYAGLERDTRRALARSLLERLGLGERLDHRPNKLSGGQQQRVSIARALINGGEIILADEPTGALDSRTGRDVMELLLELNERGHTLIVATHDPAIAAFAHRIIEIADGSIVVDRLTSRDVSGSTPRPTKSWDPPESATEEPNLQRHAVFWTSLVESVHTARHALLSHRLRTALTLIGIIIGIVSVVTMMALGEAAERFLAEDLKGVATNTIEIYPGKDWGDPDASRIQTLTSLDVDALLRQSYIERATPVISQSALLRYRDASGSITVNGVAAENFEIIQLPIVEGVGFSRADVARQAQVVVIDANLRRRFFGGAVAIGATLYINKLPCVVIGVTGQNYQQEARGGSKLSVWVPYTTAGARLIGRSYLDSVVISLHAGVAPLEAEEHLTDFLIKRHRGKDFMVFNIAERIRSGVVLFETMSLLLAAIGIVSLTVAGIGVMNIMLVSVTERAREIGLRIAVGARQSDIRRQFLLEAVLICLVGAMLGVGLSYLVCRIAAYFLPAKWEIWLSPSALAAAVASATVTGVVFGYAPARSAARLDPVEALARD